MLCLPGALWRPGKLASNAQTDIWASTTPTPAFQAVAIWICRMGPEGEGGQGVTFALGTGMMTSRSSRPALRSAGSMALGRFVAATTNSLPAVPVQNLMPGDDNPPGISEII